MKKRYPRRRRQPTAPTAPTTTAGLVRGVARRGADGSGTFFPVKAGAPEVHIPVEQMVGLADGASVAVTIEPGRKGKLHATVHAVDVGGGPSAELLGTLVEVHGRKLLRPWPAGPLMAVRFAKEVPALRPGGPEICVAEVQRRRQGVVSEALVTSVLGSMDDPQTQVEMAVRLTGWPRAFEPKVEQEAAAFVVGDGGVDVTAALAEPLRRDLRGIPHVTIDGADARDFDDAVAAAPMGEGEQIRVWVSIADVASYVLEGTALDDAAQARSTSVYFPHMALPMLPPQLSNDLCSLRAGLPRLTLTCEFVVDPRGRSRCVDLYPSLIQSAARLTYEQVQRHLDGLAQAEAPPFDPAIVASMAALREASSRLRQRRQSRGGLDLDLPEPGFILDRRGVAQAMRNRARLEAHRLIEDLMIAANEMVAQTLQGRQLPTVYRIHEAPSPERLAPLIAWLGVRGVRFEAKGLTRPAVLQKLLAEPGSDDGITASLVLRGLPRARYSADNRGHFGLGSRGYLHFTSPIRRYADLLVHRCLWRTWRQQPPFAYDMLAQQATHVSARERLAVDAERRVAQTMMCHAAEAYWGQELEATVVSVHGFGVFVRCDGSLLEGLLSCEGIGATVGDWLALSDDGMALVGERTGFQVRLGQRLRVRLDAADALRGRIDFVLVAPPAPRRARAPSSPPERARTPQRKPPPGRRQRAGGRRKS